MKPQRAISVNDILNYNPRVMEFEGKWLDSFGKPEMSGSWIICGGSGSGKTHFALELAKYLTNFGKVGYDSLEQGLSLSLKKAIKKIGMLDVAGRFVILNKEPVAEFINRLKKRKSPDILFIDSLQYSGLNKDTAKALIDQFSNKLFIFISHSEGNKPAGRTANAIWFHSDVKLFVENYKIPEPKSRFVEGVAKPFITWEEGVLNNLEQ